MEQRKENVLTDLSKAGYVKYYAFSLSSLTSSASFFVQPFDTAGDHASVSIN